MQTVWSRRRALMSFSAGAVMLITGRGISAQRAGVLCPILMYHHVDTPPPDADPLVRDLTVSPELFAEHLDYLQAEGFTTITLAQLWAGLAADAALPDKPVVLSFDDGYWDAYAQATPLLSLRSMVGTFFLVTGFMDQPGYLTWSCAAEMRAAGMEIGCHTATHRDLSRLDESEQRAEIEGSTAAIASVLGVRPQCISYPMGRYDRTTIRILEETGYLLAVTTSDATVHELSDSYYLGRVRIRHNTSVTSLAWLVNRRG